MGENHRTNGHPRDRQPRWHTLQGTCGRTATCQLLDAIAV